MINGYSPGVLFFFPLGSDLYCKFYLLDAKAKTAVVGATVSGQMYDFEDTAVGSAVNGAAVSGEDGFYDITVPGSSLSLTESNEYRFAITFSANGKTVVTNLIGKARHANVFDRVTATLSLAPA